VLVVAFAGLACSAAPRGGHAGATGAGGTTTDAAGQAGTIGAAGTAGLGTAGMGGAGSPDARDAAETGGAGGRDARDAADSVAEASPETRPPCPGAGKALHFEDDLAGQKTKSMQVWADLGDDTPTGNAARTLEGWFYMQGAESWKSEHSLFEYGGTGRCQAFGIDSGDNGTRDPAQLDPFTFSGGGPCTGDNNGDVAPEPPRTGWLHLAWVYDPTGQLAYAGQTGLNFLFTVNGVPQPIPDKKETGTLLTMKTMVSIGSGQITDDGFTGLIDEVRIWKIARSAQQIADTYKLILKGDEPGLVAYYHFDEGVGTTPKDASSAHHDAKFNTDGGRPQPTWVDATGLTLDCAP
jgi:hypothetical protein